MYAVGDIAAFPLAKYNTVTRQEHVANARGSATHAVSHILAPNDTPDYDYLPFFYSREFNLSWQVNEQPSVCSLRCLWRRGSDCFPRAARLVSVPEKAQSRTRVI